MRNNIKIIVLVFAIFFNACKTEKSENNKNDSSTKQELYFGYKPPGLIPELFVPEKNTSMDWTLGNADSLDTKEFYFTYSGNSPFEPAVIVYRQEENYYFTNRYVF